MGKVYKDKKSKGCALCKPHKHGWAPKKKAKIISLEKEMNKEIKEEVLKCLVAEAKSSIKRMIKSLDETHKKTNKILKRMDVREKKAAKK